MRSKQAFKNMISNIFLQVVVSITGIIVPRYFIAFYGSDINGMVNSINQFVTYMGLVEAGIGSAAIVSLYRPLAAGDQNEINGVLSGARKFYFKSGHLFVLLTAALAVFYPMLAGGMDMSMIRWLVIIMAGSGVIDYYFLGQYRVLLTADQKSYVITLAQAFGTILNSIATIVMIMLGVGVVWVKLAATIIYFLRFVIIYIYVKRHYKNLDFHAESNDGAFKQRWDVLVHQITGMITSNTDIVVMTLLLGANKFAEISVYSVYNLVGYAITSLLNAFNNGLTAGFGQMISLNEEERLKETYSTYEYMYFLLLFMVYACFAILVLPFISVYTKGVTDANYIRPLVAVLFVGIGIIQAARVPGLTIICAAGHFTETRNRAILEAAINLSVSLILVFKLGMVGVLIGTLCSYAYRSTDIIIYNATKLVKGSLKTTLKRLLRNGISAGIVIFVSLQIWDANVSGWLGWFISAIVIGCISMLVLCLVNFICEPQEFKRLLARVKSLIRR